MRTYARPFNPARSPAAAYRLRRRCRRRRRRRRPSTCVFTIYATRCPHRPLLPHGHGHPLLYVGRFGCGIYIYYMYTYIISVRIYIYKYHLNSIYYSSACVQNTFNLFFLFIFSFTFSHRSRRVYRAAVVPRYIDYIPGACNNNNIITLPRPVIYGERAAHSRSVRVIYHSI